MKRYVEFSSKQGTSIVVEVEEPQPETGEVRAGRPSAVAAKAKQTLEDSLDVVKPAAEALVDKLKNLASAPDEVGIEFGIKLSAEAGAFIASASTEANFSVKLTWKREANVRKA
jgi:Trypsin-co-occurring domain 1